MLSQIAMTVKGTVLLFVAVYAFAALLRPQDAKWVKGAPLTIFVGIYIIAMWGQVVWVPYLACLVAIPVFSRNRLEAALLYVVTFLAMPGLYFKVAVGSHYLFAVTKYTFCAIGLAVAYFSRPRPATRIRHRFDIPIVILLVLEFAQSRDSDLVEMTREFIPTFFTIAVPYYLLSRSINTAEDARRFVVAIALGGFVMAIVATAEARTHWLIYKQAESFLHLTSQVNSYQQMRAGMLRAPGSFSESTSLGAFLAVATIAVIALKNSFASRTKWLIGVGVLLIGLVAPNSRNALVGLVIGLVLFDFYRHRWGGLFAKIAAVGVAYLFVLTAAQFSNYAANLVGKGADTQSSNDYRVLLFRRGMQEINKHPVFGTTMKKAMENLQDIQQGQHIVDLVNGYITYGLTSGYMGMVGLLAVFVSLCLAMFACRRSLSLNPELRDIAAFVFAVSGLMILIVAFTGFGGEGSTYFYLVASLGGSVWALRKFARPAEPGVGRPVAVASTAGLRAMILRDREAARSALPGAATAEAS